MSINKLSASLYALGAFLGANALPSPLGSTYTLKERHAVPRAWTAVGPASKSETINLQIGLKQRNEGLVERHLVEVSDPAHARYGQHLTAAEIHDMVSPTDETIDLVHDWLMEHGISRSAMNPSKDWISIVVPIEKAEELLQTSYSSFRHSDGSTVSRAPEWSLPVHLHEHIDVVQPTTSFFKPAPNAKEWGPELKELQGNAHPISWWEHTGKQLYGGHGVNGTANYTAAVAAACNVSFTTPLCLRTLYGTLDYTPKVPGKNRIGINNYLNETNKRSDISLFLKTFRPEAAAAAYDFNFVIIANASNDQGSDAAEIAADVNVEGNLDAELVLSISYPTPLTAFSTGGSPPFLPDLNTPTDTNEPYLTWLNYALASSDLPQVLSTSYGDDEQSVPYSYAKRACAGYAQLGARGISVLFSSGDAGVGSNGSCFSNDNSSTPMFIPAFPTSCPWVTSVGGTAGFLPEVAVSRFGSGAGFSNYFGAPAYQVGTVDAYIASLGGLYDGLYNKTGRAYPDVAAQGNHDAIVWGGNITTVGGTSASSPTFAAVITLVNDALLAAGRKPLGFLNPWIYGGAYKALTDITSGSSIGCNSSGFPAQVGWDAVTGWGTPNFDKLVAAAFEK
ncbi:hypothetical protein LTR36_002444 [Oleoguttula mirabilis]|uniref:tripeptidyl-peptidase II n=1 Tax=Oleoguttula mirabilis TaxID=1507867 RepID=A0AAV9JMZ1_9PEZI|nr:hypothetical protein LTR36_002444 [Oleoguttula mirabilis]